MCSPSRSCHSSGTSHPGTAGLVILWEEGWGDLWGVIPKCEQDPPSIPDVLEALQECETWETLGFFLGTDSLKGLWM